MLEKIFRLSENNTTVRTELIAGFTTFLTMAYIIVVQPLVLSGKMFGFETGMDFGAVMTATCLSASVATGIMALYARYPIVQAPGMGENFFLVFSVLPAATAAGFSNNWQIGLGVVFISGILFFILSIAGVREKILDAISPSMKNAMAVGIGLFIAFIGLQNANLIITSASIVDTGHGISLSPGTLVKLNSDFASVDMLVFFFGLIIT
ncbi:MAG TPA: NCS2 family permease, partial [Desulfobacteraceae bacterium]|nr:NCS2 family permease [Desulfobacteraceae bacterium]